MIRILLLLGFIFYSLPSLAKEETATGFYRYTEDQEISKPESCRRAKAEAKLKALEQGIGETISSEELEICNSVDGKVDCRGNQFSLFEFNGIVKLIGSPKEKWYQKKKDNILVFVCEVEIVADVKAIGKISDPNFDFTVKLNNYNFRTGDELKIEIDVNKEMYLTIFQVLPYEDLKNFQVLKLFPNEMDKNNAFKPGPISLPKKGKYEVFFPEKVKRKIIDEYLFIVASEKNINWLPKYHKISDLKSRFLNINYKMKYTYKGYTIIN